MIFIRDFKFCSTPRTAKKVRRGAYAARWNEYATFRALWLIRIIQRPSHARILADLVVVFKMVRLAPVLKHVFDYFPKFMNYIDHFLGKKGQPGKKGKKGTA
jgi:hypothetical protein